LYENIVILLDGHSPNNATSKASGGQERKKCFGWVQILVCLSKHQWNLILALKQNQWRQV